MDLNNVMSDAGHYYDRVKIIYLDLIDSLGFYRIRPGKPPYICLSESLRERGKEKLHAGVYGQLLEYHQSLPGDSSYRLFPMRKYYEELAVIQEIQIILIGRAGRRWQFAYPVGEEARVIGRAG